MINIDQFNTQFENENTEEVLKYFLKLYHPKIALASSMSIEDQVITDILLKINPEAKIFTLDTGRLPAATYDLIDKTNQKYGIKIEVLFPDSKEVESLVSSKGVNSFYESIEARKECCRIRKIEPLRRALSTLDIWITGLRKGQSVTREGLTLIEEDTAFNKIKINPLLHWPETKVWEYINEHNVPYSTLYNKGYKSIGCQPCTRAIGENEEIRSGRWWWENPEHKECGLHIK